MGSTLLCPGHCSPLLHPLSRKLSSQGFSTELSKHRTLSGLQMRQMGFWFPVPGGQPPQLPPADDRAVLHGDQGDLRRDSIPSRRQSAMRYKRLDSYIQLAGSGVEVAQTPQVPHILLSGSLVTLLGARQEDSSRALTTCSRMSGQ